MDRAAVLCTALLSCALREEEREGREKSAAAAVCVSDPCQRRLTKHWGETGIRYNRINEAYGVAIGSD